MAVENSIIGDSKIKNDYDNKNTSYKTLTQLLYGDDTRIEDKLDHKQQVK